MVVIDDQVRSQLIAAEYGEVFRESYPEIASRGYKVSVSEQIHAQHVPIDKNP